MTVQQNVDDASVPLRQYTEDLQGAMFTIAALVSRLGGSVTLTSEEVAEAAQLQLSGSGSGASRTWRVIKLLK